MKTKIGIILAFVALHFGTATAQTSSLQSEEENPMVSGVIWGIKGNLSAEIPHATWQRDGEKQRMFNSGFGASIGALANIYLGKNFYFEPELSLFYTGYGYNNVLQVAPNSPSVNAGPNLHKIGIRLPVIFGYFINISDTWGLDFFTGPQLGYAFYGTAKTDNEVVKKEGSLMHVFNGEYAQSRFDIGWKIGIGFPVNEFLISLEGDLGINDMMKGHRSLHENRVSLGITYYFLRGR